MRSKDIETPYSLKAKKYDPDYIGGKEEDLEVVVVFFEETD